MALPVHPYLTVLHGLAGVAPGAGVQAVLAALDGLVADLPEDHRVAVHLDGGGPSDHPRRLAARFGAFDDHPLLNLQHAQVVAGRLVAPLTAGGRRRGTLVAERRGPPPLDDRDLPYALALAGHLALACADDALAAAVAVPRPRSDPRLALVGDDPALRAALAAVDRANRADAPLAISGPPGSGKTLLARLAHQRSPRGGFTCAVVPCAALDGEALAARLFGRWHEQQNRFVPGVLEVACGGTVVLDDVATPLDETLRARLLLAGDGELVRSIGETVRVDVRLIATSATDPASLLGPALGARIGPHHARLSALNERPDDLDALVAHFLAEAAARLGLPPRRITPRLRAALAARHWPGNLRDLRVLLEHAAMQGGELLTEADLPPPSLADTVQSAPTPLVSLAEMEARHIQAVLRHCQGNKSVAAGVLGIGRNTLYAKLREYRIE